MSLLAISRILTIHVGFILLLAKILGNGMNILVFLRIRTYRRTPCTFYFLVTSIINIIFLMVNLISRIVITGFAIDLTRTSVLWCKSRYFIIGFLSLSSFSCSCLATIDQFFVTSSNVRLRHLSKIQWTHRIVFGLISFSFILTEMFE